jgi:hypothetical protein
MIHDIPTASKIVQRIAVDAERLLPSLNRRVGLRPLPWQWRSLCGRLRFSVDPIGLFVVDFG